LPKMEPTTTSYEEEEEEETTNGWVSPSQLHKTSLKHIRG